MKTQLQTFFAAMMATTSVWAANTKVSIASQTPGWTIVQAEMHLSCTEERIRIGHEHNYLSRQGTVVILLRDQNGNPREINLPIVANMYGVDAYPKGSFYGSSTSITEPMNYQQARDCQEKHSRRYLDGLSGKPLKSVYGEYKAQASGLTSTSADFENATNQHGVTLINIENPWDGSGFARSGFAGSQVSIFVAPPSEGGSVNIQGVDTDDIGPQNLNVALDELLEMKIGN